MTLYNVYLQREIGVKFLDIEADSPAEAASAARGMATGFADRIDDDKDLSAWVELAEPGRSQPGVTLDFPAGRIRRAAPALLEALIDLLGDRPSVQHGQCVWCGRDYRTDDPEFDIQTGYCPSDDCPSHKARTIITELAAIRPASPPCGAPPINRSGETAAAARIVATPDDRG